MSDLIQSYKCAVEKLLSLARNVPDPRKRRGVRHSIDIVLTIFVLALLCDQNDFVRVEDWATRLVWSFGNNCLDYLYGREIEQVKHDIESWVIDGVIVNNSGILHGIDLPELCSRKERYSWWRGHKSFLSNLQINVNTKAFAVGTHGASEQFGNHKA